MERALKVDFFQDTFNNHSNFVSTFPMSLLSVTTKYQLTTNFNDVLSFHFQEVGKLVYNK